MNIKDNLTIVIPTLNEAKAIGTVIRELKRIGYENIIVVDGYSDDGTDNIAIAEGAKVIYQHGRGKADAIKTAIEVVKTKYIIVMDGDNSYDPNDIDKFLMHAENYDEIIGARDYKNMSFTQRLGNSLITKIFNILMGTNLSDVCSGMYLLNLDFIRDYALSSHGFSVEVELAAYVSTYGKLTQVPINFRKRIGKRKIKPLRDGARIIYSVLILAFRFNPLALFLPASIITGFIGTVLIGIGIQNYLTTSMIDAVSLTIGMIFLMLTINFLTIATLAVLIKRVERRITRRISRIKQTIKGNP